MMKVDLFQPRIINKSKKKINIIIYSEKKYVNLLLTTMLDK